MKERLLIVDDSDEIRMQLKWGLDKEYSLLMAANPSEALSLFRRHRPSVVTLDLGLPPHEEGTEEGFRCLGEILKENPFTKVIVITGNEDRENALKAIQSGAYDYYKKPIDLSELVVIVRRAFHLSGLETENRRLHGELQGRGPEFLGMVGSCPQMEEIFSTIRKIAPSDVSVLIQGESGTGKELVARAIHALSLRAGEGFIPINCGAIPENLLESELFGHEKGAFTGAYTQVQGKLEYAHNGTLFLDEIGDLPLNLQVKMLRFLQEKCIQRVGGRDDIPVDARIIAATNIDIEKAISAGKFREDLYYRLGVIMVKVPSLRERGEDVMLLSNLFLKKYSTEFKKNIKGFDQACIEQVTSYNWPGNVRELENRIQRAVIMADSSLIAPQSLGLSMNAAKKGGLFSGKVTLKEAKEQVEKEIISVAMERHKGNIAKAAEDLGISRPTLYDLLKKYT